MRQQHRSTDAKLSAKEPKVSIITPCYNAEKTLEKTVSSVISQSFKNWELILIDDKSTDQTYTKALTLAQSDNRIKVIQLETNCGAAKARNLGIKRAKGRFIAFIDADDLWDTEKLTIQITLMESNNWELSFTSYKCIDENENFLNSIGVPEKVSYKQLLKTNYIGCSTAVYDSQRIGKVFMPDIRKRQDFGLWLKILKECKNAYGIKKSLTTYRVHSRSLSSNKADSAQYNWKIYRDIENLNLMESIYYFSHYAIRGVFRKKLPYFAILFGFLHRSSND